MSTVYSVHSHQFATYSPCECEIANFSTFPLLATQSVSSMVNVLDGTLCPRCSDPFYIAIYDTKLVTTSWTDGKSENRCARKEPIYVI